MQRCRSRSSRFRKTPQHITKCLTGITNMTPKQRREQSATSPHRVSMGPRVLMTVDQVRKKSVLGACFRVVFGVTIRTQTRVASRRSHRVG